MWDRERQPGVPDSPRRRQLVMLLPLAPFAAVSALNAACSEPKRFKPHNIADVREDRAPEVFAGMVKAGPREVTVVPLEASQERLAQLELIGALALGSAAHNSNIGRIVFLTTEAIPTLENVQVRLLTDARENLEVESVAIDTPDRVLRGFKGSLGVNCIDIIFQASAPVRWARRDLDEGMTLYLRDRSTREMRAYHLEKEAA